MKTEVNIYMLPTDNTCNPIMFLDNNNKLSTKFERTPSTMYHLCVTIPQSNLIISKIRKGDYYYSPIHQEIFKCNNEDEYFEKEEKLIACTNKELQALKYRNTKLETPSKVLKGAKVIPESFVNQFIEEYNRGNHMKTAEIELVYTTNAGLGYLEVVELKHIGGKKYIPTYIDASPHQCIYTLGEEIELEDYEIRCLLKINLDLQLIIFPKEERKYSLKEISDALKEKNLYFSVEYLEKIINEYNFKI